MKLPAAWREVALLAAATAFAFALGELATRLWLPAPIRIPSEGWIYETAIGSDRHPAHAEIGWVLSEDAVQSSHRTVAENGEVIFDVEYGLANGERRTAPARAAGPRIVVTGCSFTFGHGLPDAETWPWLLQERLPRTRVVNVASMAYGTDQALMAAERKMLAPGAPVEAVVLGLVDFQVARNRAGQGWLVHLYPFGKPSFELAEDGVAHRGLVRFHELGAAAGTLLGRSALLSHLYAEVTNRVRRVPSREEAREITARLVHEFRRRFRARGAELLVVVLPWHGDDARRSRADRSHVVTSLREAGVPVLEIELPRLASGKFDGARYHLSPHDGHPNRAYNEAVAAEVARFLEVQLPDLGSPDAS